MSDRRIASFSSEMHGIQATKIGAGYEFISSDGLRINVDFVRPDSDGLRGWVTVWWNGSGHYLDVLTYGQYNLMGARTATSLSKAIAERCPLDDERVYEIVSTTMFDVIQDHLLGDLPVQLSRSMTEQRERPARWLLQPLVAGTGATSLVAPGGSSKSFVSLAIAAAVSTGDGRVMGNMKVHQKVPVLYLDWEADEDTHAERLAALVQGAHMEESPIIHYREEKAPLHRSAGVLEKMVTKLGIGLVIVDSVMLARGEDAFGPEGTLRLYAALRQLGVPSLLIQHKSLEAMRKKLRGSYGSVVNDNSARLVWEMTGVAPGPLATDVRLEVTKRNNMPPIDPIGLRVEFENEKDELQTVRIRQVSAITVEPMHVENEERPIWERIYHLLNTGNRLSTAEIADELDVSDHVIRETISRYRDRFINVGSAGHALWAASDYGTLDTEAAIEPREAPF